MLFNVTIGKLSSCLCSGVHKLSTLLIRLMVLWDPRSCSFAEMVIFPMFLRSLKLVCFEFRQEKYFPLIQIIQTVSRSHPSSYSIDIVGTFPRIRRPGHEVDHGTPFSVKVKKEWSIPTPMLS